MVKITVAMENSWFKGKSWFLDDEKGWMKVIGDIRALYLLAIDEQKDLPVLMLGHSMGSFLTRHYPQPIRF